MDNRRNFLRKTLAAAACLPALAAKGKGTIGLGLGNYGLKMYPADEAIKMIAKFGYDSVELCLIPGWPTEPVKVSPEGRRHIRSVVADLGLPMPCLLETIPILGDESAHRKNLERIRRDAQFGHDVNAGVGGVTPSVQTHLGGLTKEWDEKKNLVLDRLGQWGNVGKEMNTVISFKGHNLNLNDTSEKTLWLVKTINSPFVRVIYDYSHYQAGGESLGKSMDLLLPYTHVISIKDGRNYTDKPGYERLLPGDGTIDYAEYYRRLMKFGYTGHTVVEISAQLQAKPGYDPVYAAKHSYENVAPVMAKVGVHRPQRHKA